MEMRIVVPAVESAAALSERLASQFGTERIVLTRDRPEIRVQVVDESDRTVLRVLESVELWLDQAGLPAAEMQLGGNSYKVARWATSDEPQPFGATSARRRRPLVRPAVMRGRRPAIVARAV
jgi:hypothetical protein